MSDHVEFNRRRFLGATVTGLAATALGGIRPAHAQQGFSAVKQIDAGLVDASAS